MPTFTTKQWLTHYADVDVELRCALQDNRLCSGEEVEDPAARWDTVWIKGRSVPLLQASGLWLERDSTESPFVFKCADLFVTELLQTLNDLKIPYTLD